MNTNKIFAGFFNFFRKWKVKKNQITLVEKLNTGGTGSLFEIKNECEKIKNHKTADSMEERIMDKVTIVFWSKKRVTVSF